jgi:hypothetical protein
MLHHRSLARFVAISALCAAIPAWAQRVEIIPDCDQPPEYFVQHIDDAIEFTTTQWVEGEIRFRVVVITEEGGFVDMTESAQWIVDDPSLATVVAGVVTRPSQEIVRVTACIPGIGEAYQDIWEIHPTPTYLDPPPRTQPGVPVPRASIVPGITHAFVEMRHLGLPVIPLQGVAGRVTFLDDRENANTAGQGWLYVGKQDALTVPTGRSTNTVEVGEERFKTTIKNPNNTMTTALSHDIANAMAQREGVTESGAPTQEMRHVLNEMVDAAIMELKQDKDIPGDIPNERTFGRDADGNIILDTDEPEDIWSSEISERVIERMGFILEQARADNPDLRRIANALRTLADKMKDLKKVNPAAWEKLMRKLGWEDLDNDGIPDVLEDKLRDLGIDVDELLKLPAKRVDDPLPMMLPSPRVDPK